ncbi:MAG: hypothetical protein AAF393_00465 [Pseudomonadota bacterium]
MRFIAALALLVFVGVPSISKAENDAITLIAGSDEARLVTLVPMKNGLSSVTLVWPIKEQKPQNIDAIRAGLFSVISGGTATRTAYQTSNYMRENGIRYSVTSLQDNLLLTITAPNEVFSETLVFLEKHLVEATYSDSWYARELYQRRKPIASITRRPSDVMRRVANYLDYGPSVGGSQNFGPRFRFGKPRQAILRSEDREDAVFMERFLRSLPSDTSGRSLVGHERPRGPNDDGSFSLPKGLIHYADKNSSETLILLIATRTFENENQQIGANLLMDYIGSNQGSEMFRIIRQDLRASYDPQSKFEVWGSRRAGLMMSATVEADNWPDIYQRMRTIYENVRQGNVDPKGLDLQFRWLTRYYQNSFANDALWMVEHYLDAYPDGVVGEIRIPLFDAFRIVNLQSVIAEADTLLPPFEDFLLVIIGGGRDPSADLRPGDYCSLEKFEPIDQCLVRLSGAAR